MPSLQMWKNKRVATGPQMYCKHTLVGDEVDKNVH